MIENVGRKVVAIAAVLVAAAAAVLVPALQGRPVIDLGLDLRGGSRLVYRFDFARAAAEGQIDPRERPEDVLDQAIAIISGRVDALGLREIPISKYGSNGIVLELPGLDREARESIKSVIGGLGQLEFRIVPDAADAIDVNAEREKYRAWREKHPSDPLPAFNAIPEKDGGPRKGLKWYPYWVDKDDPTKRADPVTGFGDLDAVPVRLEAAFEKPEWEFLGEHIARTGPTADNLGAPAVSFELKSERKAAFGEFTEKYKLRMMAIILDGEVRSAPRIETRLPGGGMINGGSRGFTSDEVKELITVLRTGSLRLRPTLESEASVGASLGEDAVRLGSVSVAIGAVLVFGFMAVYYRLAGAIAIVGIAANIALILAALAFFRGTLTLPGIGGIALTIGMAVDANILIYERIREEREKGRTLAQSVANGFDKAFSAIVDSNLTTLLAGFILYKIGTGPIKGFAVTLNVGILMTLFVALVLTPVLFHVALSTGRIQELRMMRLLSKPNLRFSRYRHACIAASTLAIVVGLVVFFSRGESLFGLDFTGGATVRVRTKDALPIGTIRERVGARVPGAQVTALSAEKGAPAGTAREFVVKVKLTSAERQALEAAEASGATSTESRFVDDIRESLADFLLPSPVEIRVEEAGTVSGTVRFEDATPAEFVTRALTQAQVREAVAESDVTGDGGTSWTVRGTVPRGTMPESVAIALRKSIDRLRGTEGVRIRLADPIPETTVLGPRVVRELRDKAILAMFLSWLGIVLYLRIRFHEYRYGIAAVVALVHDVLVTLGAVSVANALGIVDVEIDLSMIAAFLTIIGFSVNDTIVIYDRIRENLPRYTDHLGRRKEPLTGIVDEALNQTLSRTILTSGTVLLTTLAMFLVNRGTHSALEGWAFAMCVGVVTGSYSTIYIASPLLVTLENLAKRRGVSGQPASLPPPPPPAPGPAEVPS